jgi:hypothetical protein
MYLVPATNLKNKKNFKVASGYCMRGLPVIVIVIEQKNSRN